MILNTLMWCLLMVINTSPNKTLMERSTPLNSSEMIRPSNLKLGDTVAVIATASILKQDAEVIQKTKTLLTSWGLNVVFGNHLETKSHHFAGTDAQRTSDLQWALDHPNIKAIWCARGGYGTLRIIDNLDFEGEMAVIMGEAGKHIKPEDALKHIVGYSCYNESTIRDWQRHTRQFGMGKNFEKTGSFGPHMVLAEDIKDYKELTLETRLNGEVMQNAKLSQLIFDIPILISYVSKAMAWRAGDVLVTGTPGGVGFKRNPSVFMKPGDKVEIEVTQIGVLSNTIKDEIV